MEVSGRKTVEAGADCGGVLCQPCHGDGENIPAEGYCETCHEYFCSSCLRFHRKQSMSRNHTIKLKDEMPIGEAQTDPCFEPCTVHKTEVVKFYCKGHDSVGCGDCMVLHHKTCRVDLVQTVSSEYKNSEDLKEINQTIEKLQNEIIACKQNIMHNLKAVPNMKEKAVHKIRMFREEMNKYLDTVEAEILKQVENMESEDLSSQRKFKEECETIGEEIAEFQSKLNAQSEKVNQLFVVAKYAKKRVTTIQESIESLSRQSNINNYDFEPSKDLMGLKKLSFPLGNIAISHLAVQTRKEKTGPLGNTSLPSLPKKTSLADMKSSFVKSINVKVPKEVNCYISGLAMIASNEFLLADKYNKSLKIVNVAENEITSRYEPPAAPWDVTKVNSGTAAATLPDAREIIFVSTDKGLSKLSSLKVRGNCRGIDYQNETLAVSFCNHSAIQLLTLNGEILHEIKAGDRSVFSSPFPGHIAWSKDSNCYWVSDTASSELSKITIGGQMKYKVTSKNMTRPRGLAVTSDGTVVVCFQENSNRIGIIAPDSKEVASLEVGNVKTPHSIFLCEKSSMLYIAEYGTDCNVIKVFSLK